jgi:hypothetical protein
MQGIDEKTQDDRKQLLRERERERDNIKTCSHLPKQATIYF